MVVGAKDCWGQEWNEKLIIYTQRRLASLMGRGGKWREKDIERVVGSVSGS